MSQALNRLRKMENRTYREWCSALRYVAECRTNLVTADLRDVAQKNAILTMATAKVNRAFNTWQQVCEALDEIELNNHREPSDD